MRRGSSRAVKRAQRLLASEGVTGPRVPVDRIARKYALVVRQPLDRDVSGMLVPLEDAAADRRWAIVVNSDHHPTRQRFTIAHELGHILLHGYTEPHADRGYVVRFRDGRSSEGRVTEEIEANQFAAELLMPQGLLLERATARRLEYVPLDGEDDPAVAELAREFEVSKHALLIRLSNLLA